MPRPLVRRISLALLSMNDGLRQPRLQPSRRYIWLSTLVLPSIGLTNLSCLHDFAVPRPSSVPSRFSPYEYRPSTIRIGGSLTSHGFRQTLSWSGVRCIAAP